MGGRPKAHRVYLLARGLARCHRCGWRLIGQIYWSNEQAHLRDVADRRGYNCPVGGRSTRTDPLDQEIGELIGRLVLPEDWQAQELQMVNGGGQWADIERERARLNEKLRRLKRGYWEVEIGEAAYRRELGEAQARLDALVIPEETDVLAAGQFLETLADVWAEATEGERKELLGLLLETVFVNVAEGRIVCVQPQAAYVALFRQVARLLEKDGCFYLEDMIQCEA